MEELEASSGQEASQPQPPCLDSSQHRDRASSPPTSNATARRAKRLTLNFPIGVQLPPPASSDPSSGTEQSPSPSPAANGNMRHLRSTTTTNITSLPDRPSTASPAVLNEHQNDNYPILTAIAAQERKVLELKEELQKAETELATLKKQWAVGEKGRKRNELIHHAQALKPLSPTHPTEIPTTSQAEETQNHKEPSEADKQQSVDLSVLRAQARLSQDLSRHNSVSHSPIDSPGGSDSGTSVSARGRTVFQSSRHARNLSLLSSTANLPSPNPLSSPQPTRDADDPRKQQYPRGSRLPRSATLPSMDRKGDQSPSETAGSTSNTENQVEKGAWRRSLPPIPQDPRTEALVRTGRQMATDFRDGLWTFIEDIRQATVGEEAVSGTGSRSTQQGSQTVQRTSSRRNGVPSNASRERSAASPRNSKRPSANRTSSTSSGKTPTGGQNMEISFWSEFGVDAPEQTPPPPSSSANHTKSAINDPSNDQGNQEESDPAAFDDNWDDWDASQPKTHTPSSSSSTFPKRDPSPSTNTSSPRTSTRYALIISYLSIVVHRHIPCV